VFRSRQWLGIFLFTTACIPALGPTQPPIQWVPEALSLGVKQSGREADHSPLSSAEVQECVELYFHSPTTPSWRGAQLKAQGQLYLYKLDKVMMMMMMTEMDIETSVYNVHLTRLIAREDFIKFTRRESTKTFTFTIFMP
jgi:hypothetical protein